MSHHVTSHVTTVSCAFFIVQNKNKRKEKEKLLVFQHPITVVSYHDQWLLQHIVLFLVCILVTNLLIIDLKVVLFNFNKRP